AVPLLDGQLEDGAIRVDAGIGDGDGDGPERAPGSLYELAHRVPIAHVHGVSENALGAAEALGRALERTGIDVTDGHARARLMERLTDAEADARSGPRDEHHVVREVERGRHVIGGGLDGPLRASPKTVARAQPALESEHRTVGDWSRASW